MAKAKPTPNTLGEFEGRDVLQLVARVTKAGDGLSKAIALAPTPHRTGDDVTVVMRCKVGPVAHDLIPDTDALKRIETYIAGTVTVVADDGAIAAQLDEQERLLEEAQGIKRLEFGDGDGEADGEQGSE